MVNAIIALPTSIGAIFTSSWGWLLRFVGASIAGIVTTPFLSMIPVLLYFDMRVRKEGFDLEVMARELQAHPGAE